MGLNFMPVSGTLNQTEERVSNLLMDIRHLDFKICSVFFVVAGCLESGKACKNVWLHVTG
jgi:hypothetical protein